MRAALAARAEIEPGRRESPAAALVKRVAARAFKRLRCGRLSVGVFVADRRQSAALNFRYRGKKKPAEILAFPLPGSEPGGMTGQILVCPAVAARRAAALGRSRAGWLEELAVHAALHVLGFGHNSPAAAREMFSLQRSLLKCK